MHTSEIIYNILIYLIVKIALTVSIS